MSDEKEKPTAFASSGFACDDKPEAVAAKTASTKPEKPSTKPTETDAK